MFLPFKAIHENAYITMPSSYSLPSFLAAFLSRWRVTCV